MPLIHRSKMHVPPPGKVSDLLRHHGSAFVKLGEYLFSRPELLYPSVHAELLDLEDHAAPLPWATVSSLLTNRLGDLEAKFKVLHEEPMLSRFAALAYYGRLPSGDEVVVHVRRPGYLEAASQQVQGEGFKEVWQLCGAARFIEADRLRQNFLDWLASSDNISQELEAMGRLAVSDRPARGTTPSQAVPELCADGVLTVRYVPALLLSDLLAGSGPDRFEQVGLAPARIAESLILAVTNGILNYRLAPPNLHPSALLVHQDNTIGWTRFADATAISTNLDPVMSQLLDGIFRDDLEQIFSATSTGLLTAGHSRNEAVRDRFTYDARSLITTQDADHDSSGDWVEGGWSSLERALIGTLRSGLVHEIEWTPSMADALRGWVVAQVVARRLSPEADIHAIVKNSFTEFQVDQLVGALEPEKVRAHIYNLLHLYRNAPSHLQSILGDLADGRLALNVDVLETSPTKASKDTRFRMLTLAAMSVAIAVLLARPHESEGFVRIVDGVLWGLLVICFLGVAWMWKKL